MGPTPRSMRGASPPPPGVLGVQYQGSDVPSAMKALAGVRKLIDAAQHIVILTGAGISAGA